MNKTKQLYLIGGILFVSIITTVIILNSLKYSMIDLTADNCFQKLKRGSGDLSGIYFIECIPDNFELDLSIFRGEGENRSCQTTRDSSGDVIYVNFKGKLSGIDYRMGWKKGHFISCSIDPNRPNNEKYYYETFNKIVDKLILTQGFTLKESSLKGGFDVLIKETDSSFIIAQFFFQYSSREIRHINFLIFSKKKFFN